MVYGIFIYIYICIYIHIHIYIYTHRHTHIQYTAKKPMVMGKLCSRSVGTLFTSCQSSSWKYLSAWPAVLVEVAASVPPVLGAAGRWCFLRCALSETEMRHFSDFVKQHMICNSEIWGNPYFMPSSNLGMCSKNCLNRPREALWVRFLRNCTTVVAELERAVKHRARIHVDPSPQWGWQSVFLVALFPCPQNAWGMTGKCTNKWAAKWGYDRK
jgi:hypothetical protein